MLPFAVTLKITLKNEKVLEISNDINSISEGCVSENT